MEYNSGNYLEISREKTSSKSLKTICNRVGSGIFEIVMESTWRRFLTGVRRLTYRWSLRYYLRHLTKFEEHAIFPDCISELIKLVTCCSTKSQTFVVSQLLLLGQCFICCYCFVREEVGMRASCSFPFVLAKKASI